MILTKKIIILCFFIMVGFTFSFITIYYFFPLIIADFYPSNKGPVIINQQKFGDNINANNKNNLVISLYTEGLSFPTSMAFVDNNTTLVLEKNTGNVKVVFHNILQRKPLLSLSNIDNQAERGLLGIAVLKENKLSKAQVNKYTTNATSTTSTIINKIDNKDLAVSKQQKDSQTSKNYSVFLYFTEKVNKNNNNNDSSKNNSNSISDNTFSLDNNQTIRNRIYKYSWDGNINHPLEKPNLLMDLPASLVPYHNGGKLKIGPDNQLYAVIGDLVTINNTLQNRPDGSKNNYSNTVPNNSSVIVRISHTNGSFLKDNPFYKYYNNNIVLKNLVYYYAYGVRNSFGIAFDPVTGNLWDIENGEEKYDEINLVRPGFNSGWHKIMGPLSRNNGSSVSDLIMFKGSHYSDPVFSWSFPIGITDIEFFNSSKLGQTYKDNVFVGDINNGDLYFFKVKANRSGVELDKSIKSMENETLDDKVADNKTESEQVLFAKGFDGRITDIETGPDGYMYILSYFDGRIYKISP